MGQADSVGFLHCSLREAKWRGQQRHALLEDTFLGPGLPSTW